MKNIRYRLVGVATIAGLVGVLLLLGILPLSRNEGNDHKC